MTLAVLFVGQRFGMRRSRSDTRHSSHPFVVRLLEAMPKALQAVRSSSFAIVAEIMRDGGECAGLFRDQRDPSFVNDIGREVVPSL